MKPDATGRNKHASFYKKDSLKNSDGNPEAKVFQNIELIEQDFLTYISNHTGKPVDDPTKKKGELSDKNSIIFYAHDFYTHKNIFISDTFESITGHSCIKSMEEPNFIFRIILEEDLAKMFNMGRMAFEYIMELPLKERKGSCMRFNYRIRRPDGTEVWILDVISISELDAEGKVSFGNGYMIDISYLRSEISLRCQVETASGNVLLLNPENTVFFSKRELEILLLINEGLASKEVATRLQISVNTVNNHRSNMMHRHQVRNMIEVLKIAKENSII